MASEILQETVAKGTDAAPAGEASASNRETSAGKRTARDIAFGIQQTIACWATDFIDPPVSKYIQNKIGDRNHVVTDKHVWWGEILGDSTAFFVFLAAKKFLRRPIDAFTGFVRSSCDSLLTKMGRKSLKHWAAEHHVAQDDPLYRQKLEEYKRFQAENIVDTGIVATAATGLNVLFQKKLLGNMQQLRVILVSKLVGAIATMGVMMGLRTGLPTSMKQLDDELGDRFAPLIAVTQDAFGVKGAAHPLAAAPEKDPKGKHPILEAFVTVGSLLGLNLAFRKMLTKEHHDDHPHVHEAGEELSHNRKIGALAGAVAGTLALHAAIPNTLSKVSEEISHRYVRPLAKHLKKWFGAKQEVSAPDHDFLKSSKIFSGAPILNMALPAEKRLGMLRMMADHIDGPLTGQAEMQAFVEKEKRLLDAMIDVFSPDGSFVRTMAQKHFAIISKLQGDGLIDKKKSVLQGSSLESMQSIVINRRDDMKAFKQLLDDPQFLQEAMQALQSPESLKPGLWMTPQRKAKLVDSLLQAKPGERGEPAVHIFASAKGQMIEHKALAECFDPKGDVTKAFIQEMQQRLPTFDAAYLKRIGEKYMQDRASAAVLTTNAYSLEGEVVREAVERSEAIRRKFQPVPAAGAELAAVR